MYTPDHAATARAGAPPEPPTRDRILDAAERLFAESGGEDGASLRDVAAAAGVRLSLVSYHYGSKEALYRAVFTRRAGELAQAREAALATALAQPVPTVADVMAAFIGPSVRQRFRGGASGKAFALLTAREATDPREAGRGLMAQHFDPTGRHFVAALMRLVPAGGERAAAEAYLFAAGALAMTMAAPERLDRLGNGGGRTTDADALVARLTAFCAAGAGALLSGDCQTAPASPSSAASFDG